MEEIARIKVGMVAEISVRKYRDNLKNEVSKFFHRGYPDSFDEFDLEFIEDFLNEYREEEGQLCLLAYVGKEIVGGSMLEKISGPQDVWEMSYIFIKEYVRGLGVGRILAGVQEELLKDTARILFAVNPGLLPQEVISYPFWKKIGYEDWGVLPGYFRDDLSGIFLVKRNPYYAIGRGIPKDSGWEPGLADSLSGKRISKGKYKKNLSILKPVPENRWGMGLVGKESVIAFNS
jgi:hypothetical protein